MALRLLLHASLGKIHSEAQCSAVCVSESVWSLISFRKALSRYLVDW